MINLKNLVLAAFLTTPLVSVAAKGDARRRQEVGLIRLLLPAGHDVAQIQANLLKGYSEDESNRLAESNYLLQDFNHDGRTDLLVIEEPQPEIVNTQTGAPCKSLLEDDCFMANGQRVLRFYLGKRNGEMALQFANDKMVLNADEGGIYGDPLNGFSVRPSGAIALTVYGGSAWRWGFTNVMQFRNGEMLIIGKDSTYGWTGDGRLDTSSINYLTGQVVETHRKSDVSPVREKKYRVPVKALEKVKDFSGSEGN